jgi:DNA segregation ATPase FtsK/SpoIIIE-like protein
MGLPKLVAKPAAKPAKPGEDAELLADGQFKLPPLRFLAEPRVRAKPEIDRNTLTETAQALEKVLDDFGVRGEIVDVRPGPVVTLYELEPAPGTRAARVISLADDIARSLCAMSIRVAVVPGRNVIGIELPNDQRETVYLRDLLSGPTYEDTSAHLSLALGKDIGGEPIVVDLSRMPHLLIAGTTGAGKSVAINAMILSLLYRLPPDQCKLIMIDPKVIELSVYERIPHLLVLGHQVGGGSGKDLATAGGVIAGAAIGANVNRGSGGVAYVDRDVQRCQTVGSAKPEYWDVTYHYRGAEHRVQMTSAPGATIRVNAEGAPLTR